MSTTDDLIRVLLDTSQVTRVSSPWSAGPKDAIMSERIDAARRLGEIGDQAALAPLTWAALADPMGTIRVAALSALWKLGWNSEGFPDPGAWQLRPEQSVI